MLNIHRSNIPALEFESLKEKVRSTLKPIETVSVEEARGIISKYTAAIEGNFIPWMAAALISQQSVQAEYATKENLIVEINNNHQGLLREFAKHAKAEPSLEHYQAVQENVFVIQKKVAAGHGLTILTIMTALETSSEVFIPYLATLARKIGSTNLQYTTIHGIADQVHADQFLWALSYEYKYYENADGIISATMKLVHSLLEAIFS